MDIKLFFTVFATVFMAEIADKTQIATFLYASQAKYSKITVFLGSSLALICASAMAVFIGAALSEYLNPKYLCWFSGSAFIIIGLWIIITS